MFKIKFENSDGYNEMMEYDTIEEAEQAIQDDTGVVIEEFCRAGEEYWYMELSSENGIKTEIYTQKRWCTWERYYEQPTEKEA